MIMDQLLDDLSARRSTEDEYMSQFSNADFQGSAFQFDVDYLERLESSAPSEGSSSSSLARESLYVKFDPLVGRPSPDSVHKQRTPPTLTTTAAMGSDLVQLNTPPRVSSHRVEHTSSSSEEEGGWSVLGGSGFSPMPRLSSRRQQQPFTPSSLATSATRVGESEEEEEEATPETASLVMVLKYSDAAVAELLDAARTQAAAHAKQKSDLEAASLREQIGAVRRQTKKLSQRKLDTAVVSSSKLGSQNVKLVEETERCREMVQNHSKRMAEVNCRHEVLMSEVHKIAEQGDVISRSYSLLDNTFDDLHQRYINLKTVHQQLSRHEQGLRKSLGELEAWNNEASVNLERQQTDLKSALEEAAAALEGIKKEHSAKLALEKTNSKKLTLRVQSLEQTLSQKVQEKKELSKICDDLMKELDSTGAKTVTAA